MSNSSRKAPKGYKPETIAKIVASLREETADYRNRLVNGEKLSIVISSGNSKIGKCMNISLAPVITCGNCSACKFFCYDIKACLQYKNVRNARAKNTAIFFHNPELFFMQLWEKMSHKKTNKYLRFHVSGEITSEKHFDYMVETAKRFPEFTIWTYTKRYDIVNGWIAKHGGNKAAIPSNFSVMFSEWKGVPVVNPYGLPVFLCVDPETENNPEGLVKCPGNCDICKANHCGCVAGRSAFVYLH